MNKDKETMTEWDNTTGICHWPFYGRGIKTVCISSTLVMGQYTLYGQKNEK